VLLSCISACGRCRFCRERRYGLCIGGGGWIFGHKIDGVQAEFARVPFADTSTYQVPEGLTDEQVLYLAGILPTGYEVGVLNGQVQPGDVVAIVGAGPVGLAAILERGCTHRPRSWRSTPRLPGASRASVRPSPRPPTVSGTPP
jgi:alcohol dehydrogenase